MSTETDSESELKRWIKAKELLEKREEALKALSVFGGSAKHGEIHRILGSGNRKPISIRIPEDDLVEIRKIASVNGRKYQQLIVHAVKIYIDNYYQSVDQERKKMWDTKN